MRRFLIIGLSVAVCTGIAGFCFLKWEPEHEALTISEAAQKWNSVLPPDSIIQNGDLVLRHGRGFISNSFKSFSQSDQAYSHAGFVSKEKNGIFVYHSIGGEQNSSNCVRKESLEKFCDPRDAHSFGIYRYSLSDEQKNMIDSLAGAYFKSGLQFDLKFDLETDSMMYCSEFIYKILCHVTHDKKFLPLSEISGFTYVAIDNLYKNKNCRVIYSKNY